MQEPHSVGKELGIQENFSFLMMSSTFDRFAAHAGAALKAVYAALKIIIHIGTCTHLRIPPPPLTHALTHTRIHTHTNTHSHIFTHTRTHTYLCGCIYIFI